MQKFALFAKRLLKGQQVAISCIALLLEDVEKIFAMFALSPGSLHTLIILNAISNLLVVYFRYNPAMQ
jgi:hypothetical protein